MVRLCSFSTFVLFLLFSLLSLFLDRSHAVSVNSDGFMRQITVGINIDPNNTLYGLPSASLLQKLGAQWLRFEFHCYSLTTTTSCYDSYDSVLSSYSAANLKVLLILDGNTLRGKPSSSASKAAWTTYITAFTGRVADIASHYAGLVSAFEIWTGEDLPSSANFDPSVPAAYYGSLLSQAYTAIKSADNTVTVVMGGLASGQPQYLKDVITASGGKLPCDAVGLHPYQRRPYPQWPSTTWGVGPLWDFVWMYHNVTTPKPIWITEMGTNDSKVQGNFPLQFFNSVNNYLSKYVPNAFWFCWSDGMVPGYGLLAQNGTAQYSYSSYVAFTTEKVDRERNRDREEGS